MTSRDEIERLLNQTGRTLEGLPQEYPNDRCRAVGRVHGLTPAVAGNSILHQCDVVELLVGALRDALDKPMQQPLTLEELGQFDPDIYVWEERRAITGSYFSKSPATVLSMILELNRDEDFYRYGHQIRAWKKMPTDEEMEAVPWMD